MRLKRRHAAPAVSTNKKAQTASTKPLDEVWTEASRLYGTARGMRPKGSWATGIGERAFGDRFTKLTTNPSARRVEALLQQLSDADLRLFHTRAVVGLEQAVAAMRLSLVVNLTLPVGALLLVDELLPSGIAGLVDDEGAVISGVLAGLIVLPVLIVALWFAYAGTHQARDLLHLSMLEVARRGFSIDQAAAQNGLDGLA